MVCFTVAFLSVDSLFFVANQMGAADLFPSIWDKLVHFVAYAGLTGHYGFAAQLDKRLLVGSVVSAIGILDETMQSFVPGRFAGADDLVADLMGVLFAIWLIGKMRAAIEPQSGFREIS